MPTTILGSVSVTPPQPRPGESVRVEVLDPQGHALEGRADVHVKVNGVPGALQFLQFAAAREHNLVISAASGATRERLVTKVSVVGATMVFKSTASASEVGAAPMMRLTQSQTNPYVATFSLGDAFRHGARARPKLRRARQVGARPVAGRRDAALIAAARRRKGPATTPPTSPLLRELNQIAVPLAPVRAPLGPALAPKSRRVEARIIDLRDDAVDAAMANVRASVKARYEWHFDDGTTETTKVPFVTHDFFPQMQHGSAPVRFHVRCVIAHGNIEVKRTLNIVSAYGLCKARGTVVPHVTADIYAHKSFGWFTASLTVFNVEDQPLTIERQAIVPLSDSHDAPETPAGFIRLETPIVLAPKSSTVIAVSTPIGGAVPADAPGFTVYHAGKMADGAPVRMTSIFEVPVAERDDAGPQAHFGAVLSARTWPWDEVLTAVKGVASNPGPNELSPQRVQVDRLTGTMATTWAGLRDVAKLRGARLMTDRIVAARLAPAYRRNLAVVHAAPALRLDRVARRFAAFSAAMRAASGSASSAANLSEPPQPGPIAEGEICDPDNLTNADLAAADAKQLVCQLTGATEEVMMPGRFMNARKGDVILSPGGTGLIGMLLRSVDPPQQYSHSGMMTRNYDEVTHSTASEDLILDYIDENAPWNGLPENMIKYMWPGVVTQPVEAAVKGEEYTHPETGKKYSISSFSAHAVGVTNNDQFMMVPPLVVKPDPLLETADIRAKLHGIADAARAKGYRPGGTPRSHYRLYCYTDPTIGQTTKAPASAGWAAGTFPSVCSSMVWMACKEKHIRLESDQAVVMPSDLEPSNVVAGAAVSPGTPDGLYAYTATERLAAAQWLYDTIYYMGYDEAGWFGEAVTDAADDLASQLCNTFARDDAKGQDSEAWRQQRDANAVSPDNILWWDGPEKGGVYGYSEPLIYREPRKEPYPISQWRKVITRGEIVGTVKFKGAPVAGANVRIFEGRTDITNSGGAFSLKDVPLGDYSLVAWKVIDGKYCSVAQNVSLRGEHHTANLALQPPAEDFRLATVFFDFWGEDYETFGSNETTDPGAEAVQIELGPDRLVNTFHREYKWGGELRAEYTFTLKLLVGNVIDVQIDCKLFEGTTESTHDLDGQSSLSLQVPMNQTRAGTLRVWNTDEDEGEDQGILTVSVKNDQNNN